MMEVGFGEKIAQFLFPFVSILTLAVIPNVQFRVSLQSSMYHDLCTSSIYHDILISNGEAASEINSNERLRSNVDGFGPELVGFIHNFIQFSLRRRQIQQINSTSILEY